jgi:hypothetical protein
MTADQNYGAHSAQVEMRLIINGSSVSATHMGPDFLFIEGGHDHPPGLATIVLQVDDTERRWQVNLPDGISKDEKRVALALSKLYEFTCHTPPLPAQLPHALADTSVRSNSAGGKTSGAYPA